MDLSELLNVLLVAALGGLGFLLRDAREKRQRLETRLHEAKREIYEKYVDVLKSVAAETKGGRKANPAARLDDLRHFAFRAPLIASDDVVMAHIRFMNMERILPGGEASLPAIADVIIALRRDMGFEDTHLGARDILGVVVNEIDELGDKFDPWEAAKPGWDRKMGWKR